MARLMIMTFHGQNRTGEKEAQHLHESPWVMTVPLIVLAVLSVFGGWINVPHAIAELPALGWLPSSQWLHDWLHPIMTHADHIIETNVGHLAEVSPVGGSEALWAAISLFIATAVIVFATRTLGQRTVRVAIEDAAPTGF